MLKNIKTLCKKALAIILVISIMITNFQPLVAYALINSSSDNSYVYLSDLWDTNVTYKKVDYNEAFMDRNEPGDLISLIVDGEKTYFLKGVFAHANSTIIYNISDYTSNGYDTFSAYLGVDTYAGSNGNGVKFQISASVGRWHQPLKELP